MEEVVEQAPRSEWIEGRLSVHSHPTTVLSDVAVQPLLAGSTHSNPHIADLRRN